MNECRTLLGSLFTEVWVKVPVTLHTSQDGDLVLRIARLWEGLVQELTPATLRGGHTGIFHCCYLFS